MAAATVVAPKAKADYQTVGDGLQQWLWTRAASTVPMTAAAVRSDGWLVVADGERFEGDRFVGGELRIVPPWGGAAVPFGRPPDRVARTFGFTRLVARGDRLFGLTSLPDDRNRTGQRAELLELDARTGALVADHGSWWFPELAVDPKTNELVLWTFDCSGQCDVDSTAPPEPTVVRHQLVRYDPTTKRSTLLLPDALDADVGGSGTCASQRDQMHICEEIFRVTFSPDGGTLFVGTARNGANAVDVRERNGALRFSFAVPRPIDDFRVGAPSTCFAGALVMTAYDGTTWVVPNAATPTGEASRAHVIAAGGPGGTSVAGVTADGQMLTLRRTEAVILACPGWLPPKQPVAAAPPVTAPGDPKVELASGPAGTSAAVPKPGAPSSPTPPAGNAGPPVQPPAVPAVAGPAAHAPQAVTSVNVGLSDAEQEQPVYSLSASRRPPEQLAWASLGVGVAAAVGFAAVAMITIPDRRRQLQLRPASTRRDLRR